MRALAVFALLASCGAAAQGSPDAFEITQRFAASGALQTALTRIAQLQPATAAAPRWGDWEQLRCELMYRLSRHQELAQRVAALPASVAEKTARTCLLQGARAAVAVAQGATARDFLARLIWRQEPAADELRQARLLVIESYLAELSQLDDASPLKLQLRLKTSLIAPEAAIAQARAALARTGNGAAWWVVLQHAATLQKDRTLLVEALENLLQLAGDKPPERLAALVAELWQSYAAAAQDAANQNQLLVGDDAKWADYASRRAAASPAVARAFFAYLAQQSKFSDTRRNAQLQLAFSLQQGKLGLTAIRLFGDAARFPVAQLDPQARYLLGSMALENNQPLTAARYWQGLATPPTLDPDEWRIRLAQALVRAGAADPGAAVLRALAAGSKALPAGIMQRAVASVQELQDAGHAKTADELYRALLPLADAPLRREILFGRGRIAEANNDFQRAADYLLEAALLIDSRATDALAVDARLAAAANLGRAGLKDDARAQLNWLRKNVKDPEKLELIRRELQKLGAASARRQPGGNHSAR
ncbi:MAG: hypothetical protein HYS65_16575 [Betaproteobacteria bacterium]|nr:hypothetical protein [Betaproteobacteria bacterium]